MSVAEIVNAYNTGAITADTYVWQDGMADWAPLADVPEINSALHAAAASQPPAAPVAAALLFGSAAAAAEPVRAATRAAASADLFGGIDTAGSEHDADERGDASVTTATTGARNESSVLFSLSALTASDGGKPGPGGKSTSEDSGLIDLAALTAAAERSDPAQSMDLGAAPLRAVPMASPLGAAPLTGGTTSPLGDMGQPPPSGSKNGLFIGGGIAVAAVVAGLVFLLKEEPPPTPAVVPTATIVVTTVVTAPAPETSAAADTKEDEKEAEEEKASPTPKKKYTGPKTTPPKTAPKTNDSKPSETPKAADPPAEKPKKSNRNCPKGDLMCAMKCSTK
jgi:hypothetical protein